MDYRKMERMLEAFTSQQSEYLQLEPILTDVSKTGVVRFPWKLIQPLLRYKMKSVLDEAYGGVKNIPDDDKDLSRQLLERFDKFKEPPFTIQRLCELMMEPKRWYKRRSPFLRGLEKNLLVVSTVEPDLSWMSIEQSVVSEEGKERLMPSKQELTCTEDLMANSDEQPDADSVSTSNKRPLVELSEADSTVTNGLDTADSQRQNYGPPPSKKQCNLDISKDTTDDCQPSNNASSTTSSPHEILHED